jgi:peptide/nickel transport system substrate-binding protein
MGERALREAICDVRAGRLDRRAFLHHILGLGLTAPMVSLLLGAPSSARAQTDVSSSRPRQRGGGGRLRILFWQAPTLLNPHLAVGGKDINAARIFYEPLVRFEPDATLAPVLAEVVPTVENGGLARDGTWVIWRLKPGVTWHDGRPLTADDLIFNWEYATDPAHVVPSSGLYDEVLRVERLSDLAVKVVFRAPTPVWFYAFNGGRGLIPRHVFDAYRGSRAREAASTLRAVGTGPFRLLEFKPGDMILAEGNPHYHVPGRPFFDTLELKGGGDPVSSARAVLQTGEYHFAYDTAVDNEVLQRLEQGGKGRVLVVPDDGPEHIELNRSDPWTEVDGERSSVKAPHPVLTDPAVRSALQLLVDRAAIHAELYGRLARTTANYLDAPARFRSPNTRWEFSVERANAILDAAGWTRGADGVRAQGGRRLRLVFQTTNNPLRQKTQAVIKQACSRAGIELELKSVAASVFFSGDPANGDTVARFQADLQMRTNGIGLDPQRAMGRFTSWQIPTKANQWVGGNTMRWRSDEYDRLWTAARTELDPVRRAALFIRMNDLVVEDAAVITVVYRNSVHSLARSLLGVDASPYDYALATLADWYRA